MQTVVHKTVITMACSTTSTNVPLKLEQQLPTAARLILTTMASTILKTIARLPQAPQAMMIKTVARLTPMQMV